MALNLFFGFALWTASAPTSLAQSKAPFDQSELTALPREPGLVYDALFLHSNSSQLPGNDADWQPVVLPDIWSYDKRYSQSPTGWYRLELPPNPPAEPWSIYMWRFAMNAEVYFNGRLIGSGGSFTEPFARNWNRPLLFALPPDTWQTGHNQLTIRLLTVEGWGHLPPPAVGPTNELQPEYDLRFFRQITLNQIGTGVTALMMLVALAFWIANPRDTTYICFALAAAAWTVFGLHNFLQTLPISHGLWWSGVHIAVDTFSVALVLFAHRAIGLHRPRFERLLAVWLIAAAMYYAAHRLFELGPQSGILHLISNLLGIYVLVVSLQHAIRSKRSDLYLLAFAMAVLVAFGLHDLALNSMLKPSLWRSQFYLMQYGAPLLLFMLLLSLARRFALALQSAKRANESLEARVQAISNELASNYQVQAATAERERIYQDLHDDVGAKLLDLVYSAQSESQRNLARDALRDIRSIVTTEPLADGNLATFAAQWRAEAYTRCDGANWALDWFDPVPPIAFSGHQAYHLERILRELLTNALKHSTGDQLRISMRAQEETLHIIFSDNGHNAHTYTPGSGIRSLKRRAAELGATMQWDLRDSAHQVSLAIPLATG